MAITEFLLIVIYPYYMAIQTLDWTNKNPLNVPIYRFKYTQSLDKLFRWNHGITSENMYSLCPMK